jgi:dTDP-4-dehydrorhamnose reductase
MKTILVTGSNGLLGQKIIYALLERSDVNCIATAIGPNRMSQKDGYQYIPLDITNQEQVNAVFKDCKPHIVINTAALTNVDACEVKRSEATLLNVTATGYLIEACRWHGAHLVHLSTDFVFDGANGPYAETDDPNPLSHYAKTKWEGEQLLLSSGISWSILRTIIIYGVVDDNSRSNVVLWTFNSLRNNVPIKVIEDQYRSPTLAEDLALACIEAGMRKSQGIYHVSGRETMSILDMVKITADYFKLDKQNIIPVTSASLNQVAKRPPVTGFIINKAERELDFRPHSFLEGLAIIKKQLIRVGALGS